MSLGKIPAFGAQPDADLLALNDVLNRLEKFDPNQARIVELRFFGGLTIQETAEVMQISHAAVEREWKAAKAFIKHELVRQLPKDVESKAGHALSTKRLQDANVEDEEDYSSEDQDESFDRLLKWLDSDRERAAEKFEVIRKSLIQIFIWKRCSEAESLADETLDRVMLRVSKLEETDEANPIAYIHAIAKQVLAEHKRAGSVQLETSVREIPKTTDIENEKMYGCFERCLSNLSPSSRNLISDYYSEEHTKKLSDRKDLAEKFGVSHNQLRVRMYRIRKTLQACIQTCMEHEGSV